MPEAEAVNVVIDDNPPILKRALVPWVKVPVPVKSAEIVKPPVLLLVTTPVLVTATLATATV